MDKRSFIAKNVANMFHDGDVVNLGVGIPTCLLYTSICLVMCIGLIAYVWSLSPDTPNVVGIATAFTLILAFFCLMAKGTMWATQEQAHIPRELAGTAIALISYLGFNLTEFAIPLVCGWWLDKHADNLSRAYDNIFICLLYTSPRRSTSASSCC